MKYRKLQRLDEDNQWFDDCYAYEDQNGQVIFQYNLAWYRHGPEYQAKLQETGTSLTDIETIIPTGPEQQWRPIEEIDEANLVATLTELDEACDIPQSQRIKTTELA